MFGCFKSEFRVGKKGVEDAEAGKVHFGRWRMDFFNKGLGVAFSWRREGCCPDGGVVGVMRVKGTLLRW